VTSDLLVGLSSFGALEDWSDGTASGTILLRELPAPQPGQLKSISFLAWADSLNSAQQTVTCRIVTLYCGEIVSTENRT
jgi:hypothetical protein